jgi:DNA-binding XRE family transcriptional regulator
MNTFLDELIRGEINDSELFIKTMNDPATRDKALAEFRAELAALPLENITHDKIPQLSRNIRRQLKKALPQLKLAAEKAQTVSGAERERLAAELREKEPDAPSFDALTALIPLMLEILEQVDRIPEPKTKTVREKGLDAFATLQGLGRFSNSQFLGDHLEAQLQAGKEWPKKGAFKENTQGQLVLRKEYPKGGVSTAIIRALDETDAMNAQLQQQVLSRLGAFTADVTLAITATMCDPRNKQFPLTAPVLVTTDRILEYKKFQQRGERREEMERMIEQAMKDLQRLHIDFDRVKVDGRQAVTIRNEQLFYVKEYIKEEQLIDGTWVVLEKGWWVTPGMWQHAFLNPAQRLWFSYGAKSLLELSHSDSRPVDQLTKLLWITLFICPAGTWHLDEPRIMEIEPLLQRNGLLLKKDSRDKDWYWQLRAHFEAAAHNLVKHGAAARWHYLPGCPPVTDQTPGAAQRWLNSRICFTDPAAVPVEERTHLPAIAQKRAELEDQARTAREARKQKGYKRKPKAQTPLPMPESTGTITAAALKQWRNERGIQQSEMARRLDVTQQYYSLMEREKRPITAELTTKLQAMMDNPDPD